MVNSWLLINNLHMLINSLKLWFINLWGLNGQLEVTFLKSIDIQYYIFGKLKKLFSDVIFLRKDLDI